MPHLHDLWHLLFILLGWGMRHYLPPHTSPSTAVRGIWDLRGPSPQQPPPTTYPYSPLPVVSAGQSVTVIFMKEGVEVSHRCVAAIDLLPTLLIGDESYTYSQLDARGRFLYTKAVT